MSGSVTAALRRVFRVWRNAPRVSLPVVAMLGLGSGVAIAFVQILSGTLFPTVPVEKPERLIRVFATSIGTSGLTYAAISFPDYEDFAQQRGVLQSLSVYLVDKVNVQIDSNAEDVEALIVSPDYFVTLGVRPAVGRFFSKEKSDGEAVLSREFCEARFGDRLACVGKELLINRRHYRVSGVAPSGFRGIQQEARPAIWLSITPNGPSCGCAGDAATNRRMRRFYAVGRLRNGVAIEQANATLKVVAAQLRQEYPQTNRQIDVNVVALKDSVIPQQMRLKLVGTLWSYGLLAGLLLALTIFNSSSLLAAHAVAKTKDFATRLSLGANRNRILWDTVLENGVLASAGVGLGLLLATAAAGLIERLPVPSGVGIPLRSQSDWRIVLFLVLLLVSLPLVCGLIPAWPMRRLDLASVLKGGGGLLASPEMGRVKFALLVAQLGLSIALVGAAGTSLDNLERMSSVHPGADFDRVVQFRLNAVAAGYGAKQAMPLFERLRERVLLVPGIEAMEAALSPPLSPMQGAIRAKVEGRTVASDETTGWLRANYVTSGYFDMLKIPITAGRGFSASDVPDSEPVVVVNGTLSKQIFGERSPVGAYLELPDESRPRARIVGVAADAKYQTLAEGPQAYAYLPITQSPVPAFEVLVKYSVQSGRDEVARQMRQAVHGVDPAVPVIGIRPLYSQVSRSLAATVALTWLATGVGVAALLVVGIGVLAAMTLIAVQRQREVGVRMAFGAGAGNILWLLVRPILLATGAGAMIGLLVHHWLSRIIVSVVYGTTARFELAAVAGVAIVFLSVMAAARLQIWPMLQTDPRTLIERH